MMTQTTTMILSTIRVYYRLLYSFCWN